MITSDAVIQLRRKVIDEVAERMLEAVRGKAVVSLKNPNVAFEFQREDVVYVFDDMEIGIYIEGGTIDKEDIMDGNIRYVFSAQLPDGRNYGSPEYNALPDPFEVFLKKGGDSDKLTELLQTAK